MGWCCRVCLCQMLRGSEDCVTLWQALCLCSWPGQSSWVLLCAHGYVMALAEQVMALADCHPSG